MLLDDERHVIKWLSQYGALTKTQVIRLLRDKTPETAEKILRNLKREHQISDVAGGYYLALDGLCGSHGALSCGLPVPNLFSKGKHRL